MKNLKGVESYQELQKIIWYFVDVLRDRGHGTVEDYARVAIPLIALKKIIDSKDVSFYNKKSIDDNPEILSMSWHDLKDGDFVKNLLEFSKNLDDRIRWAIEVFGFQNFVCSNNPLISSENLVYLCFNEKEKYCICNYDFSKVYGDGDVFADMYMDLIGKFAHDSGKKGGEFFTPTPLTSGAIRFLNVNSIPKKHLKICDPTAGSNTFLIEFHKRFKGGEKTFEFYSQELKQFQAALGILNVAFHGLSDSHNIDIPLEHQVSNVITNYKNGLGQKAGQIDVILANPPYGLKDYGEDYAIKNQKNDLRFSKNIPKKSEGEHAFLLTIKDLLSDCGQAAVIMPLGTLFRDSGSKIREEFLKDDIVEGIVSLPANMFLTTSIPVCIWVLNKNKKESERGKVFLVNAEHDFVKVGKFNEWQQDKSINAYNNREEIEGYSGFVDLEKIQKNGFNLSIGRYFSKKEVKEEIDLVSVMTDIDKTKAKIETQSAYMDSIFKQIRDLG